MIDSMPLISVIVPIYNVEKYLPKCVESILAQTYKNLEIILIDDGSPDNCGALCDEYMLKDNRIRVIHKKNGGLSSARNAGIDICSGEYLAFIDSDDFVSPYFVEILYQGIQKYDSDISSIEKVLSFCDGDEDICRMSDNASDCTMREISPREAIRLMLYQLIPTGIPLRLYKRKIFESIRFPIGYLHEDTATSHKLYMEAKRVTLVDAKIYAYRYRENGIVRMKFTPAKMISTVIGQELVHDITEYDETLREAAFARAFALNYYVFIQVPSRDKESMKKLWESILCYRDVVAKDKTPELRRKNRIGARCTYLGMRFAHVAGKLYKKIDRINERRKVKRE